MKAFYDPDKQVIVVASAKAAFAPKTLSVTHVGDLVTIWQADNETKVVSRMHFSIIKRRDGGGFLTVQSCVEYLTNEFSKPVTEVVPDFLTSAMDILK